MELLQLKYFLEVARNSHMTRTAKKLHVAQPAISQSIHRLEKELGVKLFAPKGRNIVLTEYGEIFRDRLEPLEDKLTDAVNELKNMADKDIATIHLNLFAASVMITDAVVNYRKDHPSVNFKISQNESDDLCDISVTTDMVYQPAKSENEFVFGERIFLAVPDNEKYHELKSIRLEDVRNESFISLAGQRQFRWICDRFCADAGFVPKAAFESDNPDTVRSLIAANMGIGFWPEFSWGRKTGSKVLMLELQNRGCKRSIRINLNDRGETSRPAAEFYKYLVECFKHKSS